MYDINIVDEWWDFLYEGFKEELDKIGVSCNTFYFSLDRDYYFVMNKPMIIDSIKFLKYCKIDLRTRLGKELIETIHINTHDYLGNNMENYIDEESCDEKLKTLLKDFSSQLNSSYEYLTSEKVIIETIESNGYEFVECGDLYN